MPLVVDSQHLGTSETAWLASASLRECGPWRGLESVAGTRVVVVAPHPDDEILALGGTLRRLEQAGCDICIVAVTDGEGSHPRSRTWSKADLATRRDHERRNALTRLGVKAQIIRLGYPDGEVVDSGALVDDLERSLRGASMCFSPWERDGHPDHDATGRAARRACAEMSTKLVEYPVWAWHWVDPLSDTLPWQRARRVSLPPESMLAKRHAINAYRSQVAPLSLLPGDEPVLPPEVVARFVRSFEVVLT